MTLLKDVQRLLCQIRAGNSSDSCYQPQLKISLVNELLRKVDDAVGEAFNWHEHDFYESVYKPMSDCEWEQRARELLHPSTLPGGDCHTHPSGGGELTRMIGSSVPPEQGYWERRAQDLLHSPKLLE